MKTSSPEKPSRRRRRRWPWFVAIGFLLLIVIVALKTSRLGYESPDYEVVEEEGLFELRKYAGFRTVTATMNDTAAMNRGFRQLFQYITGDNNTGEKIAMTVPVLMSDPTETPQADSPATMSFVLPREVAEAGAPQPRGENVSLTENGSGEFAVVRFFGSQNNDASQKAGEKLQAWIEERGWKATGSELVAYYDPPWTPGFLRRNEVLIQVER